MTVNRKGWGRLINTPHGQARVNAQGLVMWAEWQVWRHAEEMVENGLWTSQPSASRTRQRTLFFAVEVEAVPEDPSRPVPDPAGPARPPDTTEQPGP